MRIPERFSEAPGGGPQHRIVRHSHDHDANPATPRAATASSTLNTGGPFRFDDGREIVTPTAFVRLSPLIVMESEVYRLDMDEPLGHIRLCRPIFRLGPRLPLGAGSPKKNSCETPNSKTKYSITALADTSKSMALAARRERGWRVKGEVNKRVADAHGSTPDSYSSKFDRAMRGYTDRRGGQPQQQGQPQATR